MPTWTLDKARFAEEVLRPATGNWDPGQDLFRCYQLPLDVSDPATIEAAVAAVGQHLNQNALGGAHVAAAKLLTGKHKAAAQTLRDPGRRAAHRREVLATRTLLQDAVRTELAGGTALPPVAVAALAARFAGRFVPRQIEAAVSELAAQVREPVELDVPAAPATWSDTRLMLRTLGFPTLGSYLRSPDRALGAGLDENALKSRRSALKKLPRGDALTAEEKLLASLERWRAKGNLRDVLRRDALDHLLGEAALGPAALATALRAPGAERFLADIGLPPPEQLGYAVTCQLRYPPAASTGWKSTVEAAMTARDLRTAHDVLVAQQNLPPDYAKRRDALAAKLAEADRLLALARAAGESEDAAEHYAGVLRISRDAEAETGLRRCRPAPPPRATARLSGQEVHVEWEPSAARVGDITYRVVRRGAAGSTVLAASTSALSVVDTAAPGGTPIGYDVTTLRDEEPSARATATAPVTVLRAVTELELVPGDGVVELRWILPEGADGARVERSEDGAGAAPVVTVHDGSSVRDTGVRTGVSYRYRVEARYRVGAQPAYAAAVVGRVRPQAPPRPVLDLRAEPDGDSDEHVVVVRYTPPPDGEVTLLLLTSPPAQPSGAVLARTTAERLGRPVTTRGAAQPGSRRIAVPAGGRRCWILPLTVVDDIAVVGAPAEHDSRLPAVGGLRAVLQGSRVRLTWTWPEAASEARVLERAGTPATSADDPGATTTRVTHAGYVHEGCYLPATPGERWFSVCVSAFDGGAEVAGPLAHARLATPREARYEIQRVRGFRKGRFRRLVVSAAQGGLPGVQIRARAKLPPIGPDDGRELTRFAAPAPGETSFSAEFEVTVGDRPLHLRAFPAETDADATAIVLVPAHPAQLRID